jgi:ABC-2 type transport system permease protein
MTATHAMAGVVRRDLRRALRQPSRLVGGLARPFVWLLLVATGYNAIANPGHGISYREFVFPGVVVMACLFGGSLTAVSTVYDREFGMLRLMLASPAGSAAVLAGRAISATLVGTLQGLVVLAAAPFVASVTPEGMFLAALAVILASLVSALLGLLLAARLRSVENFAGIINVLLFPLLYISGALYPSSTLPGVLRWCAPRWASPRNSAPASTCSRLAPSASSPSGSGRCCSTRSSASSDPLVVPARSPAAPPRSPRHSIPRLAYREAGAIG